MQRRAASPYIPQSRLPPPVQFLQVQAISDQETLLITTGGILETIEEPEHRKVSIPMLESRSSAQRLIPPASFQIPPVSLQASPTLVTVTARHEMPIQSGLVVSRTFDQSLGGRQTRFEEPNQYQSQFAPVPQSTDEFHQQMHAAIRRSMAEVLTTSKLLPTRGSATADGKQSFDGQIRAGADGLQRNSAGGGP